MKAGALDIIDQYAHEFKQLRVALECDGSDLPQLLAAIEKLRAENAALKRVARAAKALSDLPNVENRIGGWTDINVATALILGQLRTLNVNLNETTES